MIRELRAISLIVSLFSFFFIRYHLTNNGRQVNTLEKYYILRETKYGIHINDRNTATESKIFNVLVIHE